MISSAIVGSAPIAADLEDRPQLEDRDEDEEQYQQRHRTLRVRTREPGAEVAARGDACARSTPDSR